MIHEWERGSATVSTDRDRLDLVMVHEFLTKAYWSPGVSAETVRRCIEHSIPFGVFEHDHQVGFARVISDQATFAYLADVFVVPEARGHGLARFLLECILAHPDLQQVRTWALFTRDAHGLYERVGFERGQRLDRLMIRRGTTAS
ncbi:MAG: GNAT family N-acetyltransferase [Chloroflexi bacterium]|nr:MAG: GNAT family N-acetyltransferase [Chloroflexota bacterium]